MEEHRTVYLSKAAKAFTRTDFTTILAQSRHDNSEANISGLLLYVRGSIIEVLEGEVRAVERLFQRIQTDQRHTDVTRVCDKLITERVFPDWTMGYETATNRQMESLNVLLRLDNNHDATLTIKPNEHIILRLLKTFYQSNRYN